MLSERVLIVAVAFAAASIGTAAGQNTIAITGRVVVAGTGDPVPHARVALASSSLDAPVVLTDADGMFTIPAAAGPHRLIVAKTGYLRTEVRPGRHR